MGIYLRQPVITKCKRCGNTVEARIGGMCIRCGANVNFRDTMEAGAFVRMGKSCGVVRRYELDKLGNLVERRLPRTHRQRRRFVAQQRRKR